MMLSAPLSARTKHRSSDDALLSPRRFVVDSALPSATIVGCLESRNARAPVLDIEGVHRVMLGPSEGWIDVSAQPGGSRIETRTEWVGGPVMERWARACAVGRIPPKPGLLARL